jgi:hypothetical protein
MSQRWRDAGRIDAYEAAAAASHDLLRAAREGNWREFDRLQAVCREIVAELRRGDPPVSLSPGPARRREELLGAILDDDRHIRDLLEPSGLPWDAFVRAGSVLQRPEPP